MIIASSIFSVIGIIIFVVIAASFIRLLQNNESGFLHLLMAFMYLCWLPIPIVIYSKLHTYDFMLIGTIFGFISLLMLLFTMVLQAGHLSYSSLQHNEDEKLWDTNDRWMLQGLLGGQVELLAGFLKGIWLSFVTVCFWLKGDTLFFLLGFILSIFTLVYFAMLIDLSLVKKVRLFGKIKLNFIVINIETVVVYSMLTIWLLLN